MATDDTALHCVFLASEFNLL